MLTERTLVENWRGRTRQVVNLIDFDKQRLSHVVATEESANRNQKYKSNIALCSSVDVIANVQVLHRWRYFLAVLQDYQQHHHRWQTRAGSMHREAPYRYHPSRRFPTHSPKPSQKCYRLSCWDLQRDVTLRFCRPVTPLLRSLFGI